MNNANPEQTIGQGGSCSIFLHFYLNFTHNQPNPFYSITLVTHCNFIKVPNNIVKIFFKIKKIDIKNVCMIKKKNCCPSE